MQSALMKKTAVRCKSAVRAVGSLRMAYPPSVVDEPMMRARPLFLGNDLAQALFHFFGRTACGKPQTVGNAENVGVHRNGVASERNRIDDVRRLSPDARQRAQLFERGRHFPAELFQNIARGRQNMRRLIMVEPARIDVFFQRFLRKAQHFFGRIVFAEKFRRHFIDALVRALRRKNDGDEQLVRRAETKRRSRVRIE